MNYKNFISRKYLSISIIMAIFSCKPASRGGINEMKNPNIIFIVVDDLGWSDLGFMGNPIYETPYLDNLSTQSVVFTDAYAPAANCAPSRASIMSGLNGPKHGVYTVGSSERGKSKNRKLIPIENTNVLGDKFFTLAEALKKNGYTNATIGKWHLGKDPKTQGFDINIGGGEQGHPKSYFSPYKNNNITDGPDGEYLTDRLTNEAIKFINNNKEKPFFLYLPYFTVHTPLQGKQHLVDKYKTKIKGDDRFNAAYGAMVESMDENVGRLLKAIKDLKIEENTLLIFTSDNGGLASVSSQFPLRSGKGSYYEGGIRVPFIIRWPNRIEEAKHINIPITGLDIYPTIIEAINDKTDYSLDGNSLLSLVSEDKSLDERALFWHFPIYLEIVNAKKDGTRDSLFRTRPGSIIRKGKWKLHEYFEDGELELYNLETDLGEQEDVSEKNPEILKTLHKALNDWRIKTNAPVPTKLNPDYQLN